MTESEKAVFAAGCFWGVEAQFRKIHGVKDVMVGYCGGSIDHPTYRQVCSGTTGHAEVAQVTFDPDQVSYRQLLDVFFTLHDPTQVDRQGPDIGTQYRSAIFPTSEQKAAAESAIDELTQRQTYPAPIATRIEPPQKVWPAEDYHQDYLTKNPGRRCY